MNLTWRGTTFLDKFCKALLQLLMGPKGIKGKSLGMARRKKTLHDQTSSESNTSQQLPTPSKKATKWKAASASQPAEGKRAQQQGPQ